MQILNELSVKATLTCSVRYVVKHLAKTLAWILSYVNYAWKLGLCNNCRVGGGFFSWCIFCSYQKKKKCWLAPSCQFIGDSMASKGNVILKPALAPSETCSHFTFELQGSYVSSQLLPHHQWTHSHEEHIPMSEGERKCMLTLQDLCLCSQAKRKHQLLRTHPFTELLQRAEELRCISRYRLYPKAKKQQRTCACLSPPWGHEIIYSEKTDGAFSEELISLSIPAAVSVLPHCSFPMAGEQVQGRICGR